MKISVYDFDNTLVCCNSVTQFVEYVLEIRSQSKLEFWFRKRWIYIKAFLYGHFFCLSRSTVFLVELKGLDKDWLLEKGRRFANDRLNYNSKIVEHLREDSELGFRVIIISGGIEEVLVPSAEKLGVSEFICSSLGYDGSICNGRWERNIRGKKSEAVDCLIRRNSGISLSESKFTSDNLEDIPCAVRFGSITAIAKGPEAAQEWSRVTKDIRMLGGSLNLDWKHLILPGYYYLFVRANFIELVLYRFSFPVIFWLINCDKAQLDILVLSWLSFILLYEIGYIDNDYFATKAEDYPSLRLSQGQKKMHIKIFIGVRVFLFLVVLIGLTKVASLFDSGLVIVFSLLNLIVYLLHNRIKQRCRLFTYPILKSSHLYIPLITIPNYVLLFGSVVVFYLPQTIAGYARKVGIINSDTLSSASKLILGGQAIAIFLVWWNQNSLPQGALPINSYLFLGWVFFYVKSVINSKRKRIASV